MLSPSHTVVCKAADSIRSLQSSFVLSNMLPMFSCHRVPARCDAFSSPAVLLVVLPIDASSLSTVASASTHKNPRLPTIEKLRHDITQSTAVQHNHSRARHTSWSSTPSTTAPTRKDSTIMSSYLWSGLAPTIAMS